MVVKLYFENIVSPDEKTDRMYKLEKIEGCLPRGWLPRIYLNARDHFYISGSPESPILTVCSSHMSPVGNLKHDFKIGENISPEFKDWISNAINRGGSNLHNIRNVRNLNVAHKREKEDVIIIEGCMFMIVLFCPACGLRWVLLNVIDVSCKCGARLEVHFKACGKPFFKVLPEKV